MLVVTRATNIATFEDITTTGRAYSIIRNISRKNRLLLFRDWVKIIENRN